MEGGIEFRSLHDVSKALFAKLWWNFRVNPSLWSSFMWNKYCKKLHPVLATGIGASHVWKKMIQVREEVEHHIWWQTKAGNASFWYDNWTKLGALYYIEEGAINTEEMEVREFIRNNQWDIEKLKGFLSNEMVDHIVEEIRPEGNWELDKAWWMGNSNGSFTVKSAWELLRKKKTPQSHFSKIWNKHLPYKFNCMLWRIWLKRISTDDNLKMMRISIVSRCWCCQEPKIETMEHVFLTAPIAIQLWRHFAIFAGLNMGDRNIKMQVSKWWEHQGNTKLQEVLRVVPAVILWLLWKRRNSRKHGGDMNLAEMVWQAQDYLRKFIKYKFPWIRSIPKSWQDLVDMLKSYTPRIYYAQVIWKKPNDGIKCNSDGASRGNPGPSAFAFCLRDSEGDLIYAKADIMEDSTNMRAEATALLEAGRYCRITSRRGVSFESDSLALTKMVKQIWKIPWEIAEIIEEIILMLEDTNSTITHVYREANKLADFLANEALNKHGSINVNTFNEMASMGRRLLNSDKQQIPNLRIKTRRISTHNASQ